MRQICTFPDCGRPGPSRGLCAGHKWQRNKGQELTPLKQYISRGGRSRSDKAAYHREWYLENQGVQQARIRENMRALRRYLAQIKVQRGCADCGYNTHPDALDFDHLPGYEKLAKVAALASSRDRLDAEIAKCEVVCANCHRIRTAKRAGWEARI